MRKHHQSQFCRAQSVKARRLKLYAWHDGMTEFGFPDGICDSDVVSAFLAQWAGKPLTTWCTVTQHTQVDTPSTAPSVAVPRRAGDGAMKVAGSIDTVATSARVPWPGFDVLRCNKRPTYRHPYIGVCIYIYIHTQRHNYIRTDRQTDKQQRSKYM